ncbi:MAG: lactonase family protein [Bacteroidetes bacterium]|nr:lactonase family protein [Bacteroidota bacterium]
MKFTGLLLVLFISLNSFAQSYYMFVGTYTSGKSEGIYVYKFNTSTGEAALLSTASAVNPSYLAIAPNGKYVYSVNESGKIGEVSAFEFDRGTGRLHFINKQSSGGADPCYISIDKTNKWAVVANYTGGSLAALPINADGSLAPLAQLIQHTGSGFNKERQDGPHVHSAVFSADQHFLFSADLGLDKEFIYHFNPAKKEPLSGAKDSTVAVEVGSGPRHFVFHPTKPYAYLLDEMSGTVEAFSYTNTTGGLKHFQRISSHPSDFKGALGSADIHISPNGKFLYASNRGDENTITIYAIDANGKLTLKGFQPVLGQTPRNFMIDPSGHFLLVANQQSDNVVIFSINQQTGLLKATGRQIKIPNPVCLKMMKM